MTYRQMEHRNLHSDEELDDYLVEARRILADLAESGSEVTGERPAVTPDFEHLRWFTMPDEVG